MLIESIVFFEIYEQAFLYKDGIVSKLQLTMHHRNLLDLGLRKKQPSHETDF